jgi:hypothetical protein
MNTNIAKNIEFLCGPDSKRDALIFENLANNKFSAQLLQNLKSYGFQIQYPLFATRGEYHVRVLKLENAKTKISKNVIEQNRTLFKLPLRLGRFLNTHYFLHELIHFYQDMTGMFLTSIDYHNDFSIMIDPRSAVRITLFCEAMAQTEAIMISWALKEKRSPAAWNGARKSTSWRKLALMYQNTILSGHTESEAAQVIFKAWYTTPQRNIYEWQAIKRYAFNLDNKLQSFPDKKTDEVAQYFRSAHVSRLIDHLRISSPYLGSTNLEYLQNLDLDSALLNGCHNPKAHRFIKRHESHFGQCDNSKIENIILGSPVYIWANA